jgi:hypothetical protein
VVDRATRTSFGQRRPHTGSSAQRQTKLWDAHLAAARQVREYNELIAADEAELRALQPGIPVTSRHLREAGETGEVLDQIVAWDQEDRIDDVEHAIESLTEARDEADTQAMASLWDATHLADIETGEAVDGAREGATFGIADAIERAEELVHACTERRHQLLGGEPIPVTAWHVRIAVENGWALAQAIDYDRHGKINALNTWITDLTRAIEDGRKEEGKRQPQPDNRQTVHDNHGPISTQTRRAHSDQPARARPAPQDPARNGLERQRYSDAERSRLSVRGMECAGGAPRPAQRITRHYSNAFDRYGSCSSLLPLGCVGTGRGCGGCAGRD